MWATVCIAALKAWGSGGPKPETTIKVVCALAVSAICGDFLSFDRKSPQNKGGSASAALARGLIMGDGVGSVGKWQRDNAVTVV